MYPLTKDVLMIFSMCWPSTGKISLTKLEDIGSSGQVVGFADITSLDSSSMLSEVKQFTVCTPSCCSQALGCSFILAGLMYEGGDYLEIWSLKA